MHWSWVEKALRLLAWQTPCLHSDILSKSPGPQPPAHLPSALAASAAHVAREARRGTFPRMSSGSEQRARIVIAQQQHLSKGWPAIIRARPPAFLPTPDHRPHTYPSSVHTPPPATPPRLWQLIGGGRMGQFLVLNVHRLFQEPKGFL